MDGADIGLAKLFQPDRPRAIGLNWTELDHESLFEQYHGLLDNWVQAMTQVVDFHDYLR